MAALCQLTFSQGKFGETVPILDYLHYGPGLSIRGRAMLLSGSEFPMHVRRLAILLGVVDLYRARSGFFVMGRIIFSLGIYGGRILEGRVWRCSFGVGSASARSGVVTPELFAGHSKSWRPALSTLPYHVSIVCELQTSDPVRGFRVCVWIFVDGQCVTAKDVSAARFRQEHL